MDKSITLTTETRRHRGKSLHFGSQCLCASVVKGLFPNSFTRPRLLNGGTPMHRGATHVVFNVVAPQGIFQYFEDDEFGEVANRPSMS